MDLLRFRAKAFAKCCEPSWQTNSGICMTKLLTWFTVRDMPLAGHWETHGKATIGKWQPCDLLQTWSPANYDEELVALQRHAYHKNDRWAVLTGFRSANEVATALRGRRRSPRWTGTPRRRTSMPRSSLTARHVCSNRCGTTKIMQKHCLKVIRS